MVFPNRVFHFFQVVLTLMATTIVGAQEYGLDVRPVNSSCVAFERSSASAAVQFDRVYPALQGFQNVTQLIQAPGSSENWYFATREGIIGRFSNQPGVLATQTVLDLTGRVTVPSDGGLIQLVFHPRFPVDPRIFVNYSVLGAYHEPHDIVLSSFEVSPDGATIDPLTEKRLIVQPRNTVHQGGFMAFGSDGLLYAGFGDGGKQGDPANNAQTETDLRGKMVRIDVDNVPLGEPYRIPGDNPNAGNPRCAPVGNTAPCPEIFAKGFRNPFRGDIDLQTGEIWVGDVGWLQREEVDKVVKGGNYGWAVCEGNFLKNSSTPCNDPMLINPVIDYGHANGNCAVIGGFVYRGAGIPALQGRFVYGDYCSGKVSAVQYDANGVAFEESLLPGGAAALGRIFTFARDNAGEVYLVSGSAIYKMVNAVATTPTVPTSLSATGCFNPSDPKVPAAGLIPYDLNSPLWSDGADKRRWMALPDDGKITISMDGDFQFPVGTVLAKEFSFNGVPHETRLLVRHQDGIWSGYSYEWRADGSDADLLPAGKVKTLPSGVIWTYPSRAECLRCHTDVAGFSLGPELGQLNRTMRYLQTQRDANELDTLEHIGVIAGGLPAPVADLPAYASLDQDYVPLAYRVKSYLHSNCSGCHRPGEVTQAPMDFRFGTPVGGMNACQVEPGFGNLGVPEAKILAPGNADASVMFLRDASRDPLVQMPPLGTAVAHQEWLRLLRDWISDPDVCAVHADTDGDNVPDNVDNCPNVSNQAQQDTDRDGVGNACVQPPVDTEAPSIPGGLSAVGLSASEIHVSWTPSSDNVAVAGYRLFRDDSVDPLRVLDPTTRSHRDTGLMAGATHRYSVSAFDAQGNESAQSLTVSASTISPAPFLSRDIGAVGVAGSISQNNGTVTVNASGADIWGRADEFHFAYRKLTGDGEIVARVDSLRQTNLWAKAGLMVRESLNANARHAMLFLTPNLGAVVQTRKVAGGWVTKSARLSSSLLPEWLRLVRRGDTFTSYVSQDGVNWRSWVAPTTVRLPAAVYIGLAVTSHKDGAVTSARFGDVKVTGNQ